MPGVYKQRKNRFRAQQPVRLVLGDVSVKAVIIDISAGFAGVGLRLARPVGLFPGTKVNLHFSHDGQALRATGQVRWANGGSQVGIRILSVSRDQPAAQSADSLPPSTVTEPSEASEPAPNAATVNPAIDSPAEEPSRPPEGEPLGSFAIRLSAAREIVCRHLTPGGQVDLTVRGVRAEDLLAELDQGGLLKEPGQAAWVAGELALAERALRLGLDYAQSQPLQRP